MLITIIIIALVVSVLLVLVVLVQNKSGGLAQPAAANQLMGVKKTTDLLEKVTWTLAIGLIVLSVASNMVISPQQQQQGPSSVNVQRAQENPMVAPPTMGQPQQQGNNTQGQPDGLEEATEPADSAQ